MRAPRAQAWAEDWVVQRGPSVGAAPLPRDDMLDNSVTAPPLPRDDMLGNSVTAPLLPLDDISLVSSRTRRSRGGISGWFSSDVKKGPVHWHYNVSAFRWTLLPVLT